MDESKTDENTSAMVTSDLATKPRNKNAWRPIVEKTWGPSAEPIRVSSVDRNGRFVIAKSQRRTDGSGKAEVILLGVGDSYATAYASARASTAGVLAAQEFTKVTDMMKSAIDAKSAGEFADSVMRATLDEATAAGASPEELDALKSKFEAARKLINDDRSEKP